MGFVRFFLLVTLLQFMAALPIKMVLRWTHQPEVHRRTSRNTSSTSDAASPRLHAEPAAAIEDYHGRHRPNLSQPEDAGHRLRASRASLMLVSIVWMFWPGLQPRRSSTSSASSATSRRRWPSGRCSRSCPDAATPAGGRQGRDRTWPTPARRVRRTPAAGRAPKSRRAAARARSSARTSYQAIKADLRLASQPLQHRRRGRSDADGRRRRPSRKNEARRTGKANEAAHRQARQGARRQLD